jgi:hypothetical protein
MISLLAGCAGRSRIILVDAPAGARKAADLTAREWGFHFLQLSDGRVVYQSAGLAGPSNEQLRLSLDPIERGEVRATAKFTGPTAGAERFFLSDLQRNISTGTILPVAPGD